MPDLIYYPDTSPGYRRARHGRGFTFFDPDGARVKDGKVRQRLQRLAVPPAYEDVWYAPMANAHLLATGRDARGRKQYRYHPDWQRHRSRTKFDQLAPFAENLPRLRRWIDARLSGEIGDEETALAAVLALIDRASLRPGHESYVVENQSYGATTLRTRHAEIDSDQIKLSFTGKGGKRIKQVLRGGKLAKVLEASQDLPGPSLVGWLDADDTPRTISPDQVNARLSDLCGEGVTAKTLRTWHGTLAAFSAALDAPKLTLKIMAEAAAERLHNTPAIAQNSYIHPRVLNLAEVDATERAALRETEDPPAGLRRGEATLRAFLA